MEEKNKNIHYRGDELVAKAKAGDEAAFKQLYNQYKGRILAYLYNYLGDYQKAEEICQDTFISVYKHLATYEPRHKFSSWLYKIATNLAKDELRRRKRQKEKVSLEAPIGKGEGKEITLGDIIPDESLRPDVEPREKELEAHVLGVINALPAKYRDVLLLCDVQGLNYEDAARVLNCSPGLVSVRLLRARRQFRKKLKLNFGDLNLYIDILKPLAGLGKKMSKMKCIFIKPIISSYIDGECSGYLARLVERHLQLCPDCYQELVALQESIIMIGQLAPSLVPSAAFETAFEQRLAQEKLAEIPQITFQDIINKFKEKADALIPPVYAPRQIPLLVPVRSLVSILLIMALSFSFFHTQIGYLPTTMLTRGKVSIYTAKTGEITPLFTGVKLARGDVIYVDYGLADIELSGVYKIRLKQNTQLAVNKLTRSRMKGLTSLGLDKGTMLASTKPRLKGSELRTTTPTGTASVYGTEFMLLVPPEKDKTELLVREGEVTFTSHYGKDIPELASTVITKADHKIITKLNELPSLPAPLTLDEQYILEEVKDIGKVSKVPRPKQYMRPEEISKLKITVVLGMTDKRTRELFQPLSLAIETTKGRETAVHKLLKEAINLADQAQKRNDTTLYVASIKKLEEIIESYPHPNHNPQILVYIGSYYEQLSMHKEALKAFKEVLDEYPKSEWASLAQCATGVIYEEKLNNPKKAKEAYQKVLQNYPDSVDIKEAKNGLLRLLK